MNLNYFLPAFVSFAVLVSTGNFARAAAPELWKIERVGEPTQDHPDVLRAPAFSPDGQRLSSSNGLGLRLWDATTGEPIGKPLLKHRTGIFLTAWSPDGRYVASGGYDGLLVLWDAERRQLLWEAPTKHEHVYAIAFSPDGSRIATGGKKDGSIRLWERATGRELGQALTGHAKEIMSLAFAGDGKSLVSISLDGSIRVWNADSGTAVRTIETGLIHGPRYLALHPRQPLAAVSNGDSIAFWNYQTGVAAATTLKGQGAAHGMSGLAFTSDGQRLMSADSAGGLALIDWQKGITLVRGNAEHRDLIVWQTAFSPVGNLIATAGKDGVLGLWRATVIRGQKAFSVAEVSQRTHPYEGAQTLYSDDGRYIAYGHKRLVIVERVSGKVIFEDSAAGYVSVMLFSPDSKGFAFINGEQRAVFVNLATKQRRVSERGQISPDRAAAFSPDGRRFAIGVYHGNDGAVSILDTQSASEIGKYSLPRESPRRDQFISSVAFSPDGKVLLAATRSGEVFRLNPATQQLLSEPWEGAGYQMTYSPDGRRVAFARHSQNNNFQAVVLDAASGAPLTNPMTGHVGMIVSLLFTPDSRYLLTVSNDGMVMLWDAATGVRIGQERISRAYTTRGYQFTRNARQLFGVSGAGTAQSPFLEQEWRIAFNPSFAQRPLDALPIAVGPPMPASKVIQEFDFQVTAAEFEPRSHELVIGSSGTLLFVKDGVVRETGDYLLTDDARPEPAYIRDVTLSRDARRATAGADGSAMRIYDVPSARPVSTVKDFGYGNHAFLANGKLALAMQNGYRLVDPETGKTLSQHPLSLEGYVTALASAHQASVLVIGTDQGMLQIVPPGNTSPLRIERAHRGRVTAIAFSPNDRMLASSSDDGRLRLFDVSSGRPLGGPWHMHARAVTTIRFSTDGRLIASGGSDGTLRVWNVQTGEPLTNALTGHNGAIFSILNAKPGEWLSIAEDQSLRRWTIKNNDCAETAADEATLIGDNVNLRDQPNATAAIIATLPFAMRVRVLERAKSCTAVADRTGRWLRIRVIDAAAREGWIFDPFVMYEAKSHEKKKSAIGIQ